MQIGLDGSSVIYSDLSSEQKALLEEVDRACRELRPIEDQFYLERRFNDRIVPTFRKYSLLGLPISSKYGKGRGVDTVTYALALERIGMEGTGVRTFFSGHISLGQLTVERWGNEEQKERYLTPATRGDIVFAFGLTEPEAGSDPASLRTEFEAKDGHYVLNGTKYLISNGSIADVVIVFAYPKGKRDGMCAFIVNSDSDGFQATQLKEKVGMFTSDTAMFEMRNVKVPKENLLGPRGKGLSIAYSALMNGRLSVAAGCVGVIRDCLEEVLDYSKKKTEAGKVLGRNQWVQSHIADIATKMEAARDITYAAATIKARYDKQPSDVELRSEADRLVAQAKYFASNAAHDSAEAAVKILGYNGQSFEYRSPRHLCDVRVTRIYEGTDEIMQLRIASLLLGRDYEAYQ